MDKKKQRFEFASDNIFEDIGVDNSKEELKKAELVWEIEQAIKKKKLTPKQVATLMGISEPECSMLFSRQLDGLTVKRLRAILRNTSL